MLVDGQDRVFLINRNNHVSQLKGLRFPSSAEDPDSKDLVKTLLDGELVVETDGTQRFLIYDVISLNGDKTVARLNFDSDNETENSRYKIIQVSE